ncbi:MAG: DUF2062 domain-containing protein [Phycisphaerales bacterium]|nr:DUF2062 domain-containing protein [Phycisphaerales bacterium]
MSGIWRSARNFIYKRILHADDSPHRLAMGVAIGLLVGFTPTMGAQTFIAIAIAALFRANKAVCIPMVWVTNPLTFVPVYGFCWWLGSLITGGAVSANPESVLQQLQEGGQGFLSGLFTLDFWASMFRLMMEFGAELWIGCLLIGLVTAIPMYFVTRRGITTYRTRRADRLLKSQERRRVRRLARAEKAEKAKKVIATDAM